MFTISTQESVMVDEGYIKIYRKLAEWEWHDCPATLSVLVHILIGANYEPKKWHGLDVERGQMIISVAHLASMCGVTYSQARTALSRLVESKVIEAETSNQNTIITLLNYDKYQASRKQIANESQTEEADNQLDTELQENCIANESQTNRERIATTKERKNNNNLSNTPVCACEGAEDWKVEYLRSKVGDEDFVRDMSESALVPPNRVAELLVCFIGQVKMCGDNSTNELALNCHFINFLRKNKSITMQEETKLKAIANGNKREGFADRVSRHGSFIVSSADNF